MTPERMGRQGGNQGLQGAGILGGMPDQQGVGGQAQLGKGADAIPALITRWISPLPRRILPSPARAGRQRHLPRVWSRGVASAGCRR